jgi:lipopolysaccharide/colanic/teichoic acid biosynthesis glycosyltransferase
VKRAEDIILGSLLFVLAMPAMLLIAAVIRLDSPGPLLFRQTRSGRGARPFTLLKFRTMHAHLSDHGAQRQTCRNDDRVTRVGRVLRRMSLDELPQLINVIQGSMSLVGPRPHALNTTIGGLALDQAVALYRSRYRVKPGITGLAQVNGTRGELTSVEKLARRVQYDVDYIDNWSLRLDLRIIWRTVRLMFRDKHAY